MSDYLTPFPNGTIYQNGVLICCGTAITLPVPTVTSIPYLHYNVLIKRLKNSDFSLELS